MQKVCAELYDALLLFSCTAVHCHKNIFTVVPTQKLLPISFSHFRRLIWSIQNLKCHQRLSRNEDVFPVHYGKKSTCWTSAYYKEHSNTCHKLYILPMLLKQPQKSHYLHINPMATIMLLTDPWRQCPAVLLSTCPVVFRDIPLKIPSLHLIAQ